MLSPFVFDAYVAPARLRPQLWRLLAGLALGLLIYVAFLAALTLLGTLLFGGDSVDASVADLGIGSTPWALIALLFSFTGMALGAFAAVRWLHQRPVATLFGPRALVMRDFVAGVVIFGLVAMPGVVWFLFTLDLTRGVPWVTWLAFLPLALLGLLIQTGAEEVVFRGYMQQQLAARFASRWVWMVLPSVIFGLVHYAPAEMGGSAWLIVLATGSFGLIMADLTARSGSLGMAWGLHFANNCLAMLLFTTGEALDALALYRLPFSARDVDVMSGMIALDLLGFVVLWGICRLWLRGR